MIEAGIFDEDDRVELINGELRAMPPIKADHQPAQGKPVLPRLGGCAACA
jgi:hypothetical protein